MAVATRMPSSSNQEKTRHGYTQYRFSFVEERLAAHNDQTCHNHRSANGFLDGKLFIQK